MSDDDILMDTIRAANADEDQVDDQPEVEQYEEPEPQVFAGKYHSIEDLEAGYKELERKFHEARQQQEQQQYEPEPQVQQPQYFGNEPSTEEELVSFAEQNPTNAAMWVLENSDRLPDDLANAVLEHWWTMKPWEATQYWMERRLEQERDQLTGMTMPLVEQHERAVMGEAYQHLIDAVPDYEDYQQQVEDFIEQNDVSGIIPPGSENDPVALAEGIGTIVGILKWREYQEAMRNQGMIVPDEDQQVSPQVSTRNTTDPASMGDDEMDDLIRNMILNA